MYQTRENISPLGKILIVDDETDICFFLSQNLSKRGYTTCYTHTLSQAEQEIERVNPNVLLLDNHLPDGSGIELLEKVHQKHPDVKVVMITAHDSQQDRTEAFNKGVDFFLAKPFTFTEVNKVVDLMMTEKRQSWNQQTG